MPKLREKIAISRAETEEEKVELIKATNDIKFIKDVIEGKKITDLMERSIIELIDAFDLYEDVLTGKIKFFGNSFLDSYDKIKIIRRNSLLSEKVLTGEVVLDDFGKDEKLVLAEYNKDLARKVLTGEIEIKGLDILQQIDLAKSNEELARDVLLGKIEIKGLNILHKIMLAKSSENLSREILLGEIKIEGLSKGGKIEIAQWDTNLTREVLLGKLEIEGLELADKLELIDGNDKILQEIFSGEIEIEGLTNEMKIASIRPRTKVAEMVCEGKFKGLTLDVENIVYLQGGRDDEGKKAKDKYLKDLHKVLSGEMEPSEIQGNNIDSLMNVARVLGPDKLYLLIRYYNSPEDRIAFDKLIESPETFNSFSELAKKIFTQQPIESMEVRNTITQYNENSELILDCMSGELSEDEEKLLGGVLKEGGMKGKITSKNGLQDFPMVREEMFAQMIEKNSKEAVFYLLSGMGCRDYYTCMSKYLDEEQMKDIFNNFEDDQTKSFQKIKVINEMIELIESMDEDRRKQVLHEINSNLANEFTEKGSEIADMRNAFEGLEIQIRRLYGQELSQTLADVELPKSEKKKVNDVEIIKLDGQDFTLLIHMEENEWGKRNESEVRRTHICTSLISQEHMARYRMEGFCFGFKNIKPNAMVMEGSRNLGSNSMIAFNSLEVNTGSYSFTTATNIIEGSKGKGHNEVVLWRDYINEEGEMEQIVPDYLVAFGKVDKKTLAEAKRLGVPVVLIDEEKYKKKISEKKAMEPTIQEEQEEVVKFKPRDIYRETIGKVVEIVPALKQEESMQEIVAQMQKGRDDRSRAESCYER